MTFKALITELLKREGGYVDHSNDPGGATNYGITERVARRHGYHGHMKDLPRQTAEDIYMVDYWERPNFSRVHSLSALIADELFDTGVNMGVSVASSFLQRALNGLNLQEKIFSDLLVDGRIGNKTMVALAKYLEYRGSEAESVMVAALNCFQGERYFVIAEGRKKSEDFLYGWLRTRVLAR